MLPIVETAFAPSRAIRGRRVVGRLISAVASTTVLCRGRARVATYRPPATDSRSWSSGRPVGPIRWGRLARVLHAGLRGIGDQASDPVDNGEGACRALG